MRPGASQIGLVLYGADAKVVSPLSSNLYRFQKSVEKLHHKQEIKRMDKALQLASNKLFAKTGGARDGVNKFCLVITDGKNSKVKNGLGT